MSLFPDKTRNSLQLGRIPPRCTDDTVCCAAAAAGWLWMEVGGGKGLVGRGQLECSDEMEKFQRSEHLHAEGNWRLPPKNSARYAFNSTPQRDRATKFRLCSPLTKRLLHSRRQKWDPVQMVCKVQRWDERICGLKHASACFSMSGFHWRK